MILLPVFTASLVVILEIAASSEVTYVKSFDMKWTNPRDALISCTRQEEKYVHVVTASGYKHINNRGRPYNETYELTHSELFSLELACSCEERCTIPELEKGRRRTWTLVIQYKCQGICFICENNVATISCVDTPRRKLNIMYANYGRTSLYICMHPSKPTDNTGCRALGKTLETVQKYCQNRVSCELYANNDKFGDPCSGTYKYLEVQFECQISETEKPSTPIRSSSTTFETTTSTTTSPTTTNTTSRITTSPRASSDLSSTSTTVFVADSTIRNNSTTRNTSSYLDSSTIHSSTQYYIPSPTGGTNTSKTLGLESDASKSTITAIAVSVSISVVAISAAIFILVFRRLRRKSVDDAVYKNGTTIARKNEGDGFTNMIYSKETDDVILQDNRQQSADTNSNSGDSGYTDMHNEDSRDAENNNYYMIKENMVPGCAEIVDDQYYAIKDNVGSEYNKITFKPKDIPDDPNYGHTLRPGIFNTMDVTYDHAEGSSTSMHIQLQEEANDYSHLNQYSSNGVPKVKHNAFVHQDQVKSKTNEIDGALAGREYFILEQSQNKNQANSAGSACHNYFVLENDEPHANDLGTPRDSTDEGPHDYFVLSKEGTAGNTPGSNSVFQPNDGDDNPKQNTQAGTRRNDFSDHTYFENPLSSELDNDAHQYQAMGQRISTNEPDISENVNHDYFILQQETA